MLEIITDNEIHTSTKYELYIVVRILIQTSYMTVEQYFTNLYCSLNDLKTRPLHPTIKR